VRSRFVSTCLLIADPSERLGEEGSGIFPLPASPLPRFCAQIDESSSTPLDHVAQLPGTTLQRSNAEAKAASRDVFIGPMIQEMLGECARQRLVLGAVLLALAAAACTRTVYVDAPSVPSPSFEASATVTTTSPTASSAPVVYCEDPAVIDHPPAGCIQEDGGIYTPIPDSVGTDFTCYGYAKEALNDAEDGVNDLNARDWYVSASDFDIASAGFQTIEDYTTGPLSIRAHNARVSYYLASEDILRGAIREAYKFAQFGDRYAQQVIALATHAGTSCTIPALAGLGG
jgi:hypothetical protein